MKQFGRRIPALVMALCLCLSLCALSAKAEVDRSAMPGYSETGDPTTPQGLGTIYLSLKLAKSGSDYSATYSATTTMIDWLAEAAAVCKDDPRMANLRFTCTLEDKLTAKLENNISAGDYSFTSAKYNGSDIFVLDEPNAVEVSDGKLKMRYKLNPVVLSAWSAATTAEAKAALQQEMTMTATKLVPSDTIGVVGSKIYSTARIDITTTDSTIPFYHVNSIWAAFGDCSIGSSGGGGGGNTTPETPSIEIKDNTPTTGADSGVPEAGGTITVDKPNAKPGETVKITTHSNKGSMIDHITVTDTNNNRVPLAYEGEGNFTFVVPEDGKILIETVFRTIPADPDETGVSELLDTDNHRLYLIGDEKGDFRPEANITRAEIATAFFRLLRNQDVERTAHFDDVEDSKWYVQPIEVLASLHIIEGIGDGVFEPDRAITRAEFAAVAARFASKVFTGTTFKDVSEDAWYADFVSTAAHFGWINGVGNGEYEPDRDITRTEAAAIINRMLLRISDWIDVDAGHGRHFPDVSEDFWGKYEISEATNNHDHTLEDEFFFEDWHEEDWRETVDNDPVNFGQPKF